MAQVTLRGNPVNTSGELPAVGSRAPAFTLVKTDMSELKSEDLSGKRIVLNIFLGIDTSTCQASARAFNEKAAGLNNTVIICVSKDLPFALNRYCGAEGLDDVVPASAFRSSLSEDYGITMLDGPLAGLPARAVVVIDEDGIVRYTQLVSEVSEEPDYEAALASLS